MRSFLIHESQYIYRMCLANEKKLVGFSRFSIPNKDNEVNLIQIEISKHKRNKNYGSLLIDYSEKFLVMNYPEIKKLIGCVWQNEESPYVLDFFRKNGYEINLNERKSYYDDGILEHDLIPIIKYL